jgi:hypothetical protein
MTFIKYVVHPFSASEWRLSGAEKLFLKKSKKGLELHIHF